MLNKMARPILWCVLLTLPGVALAQTRSKLDTASFVVLGEGLAAGMADYGLSVNVQDFSFPAQVARQMKTIFPQPLIQGPGLEGMFGLPTPVARVPTYPQTTVRIYPVNPLKKVGELDRPSLFVFNLSVPNFRLSDSLTERPRWPLIQASNPRQTTLNFILGAPALLLDNEVPLWTQLEYAVAMNPTLALIELGYFEALDAAATGDPAAVPDAVTFQNNYTKVVKALRSLYAEVVVTTIPDPTAAAYFMPQATAARLLRTQPAALDRFGLQPGDFVTRPGLYAISNKLLTKNFGSIPPNSILSAAAAAQIRTRVNALNAAIIAVARANGAVVYDLNAFFARVRASGATAGRQTLTADYLGGFYSLDGVYPSATGHALIANDLVSFLNATYNEKFPPVDLTPLVASDPALFHRGAQ